MQNREEVVAFCMGFEAVYEDYPFDDWNWTIMRHKQNKKMFAAIYEREGHIWINVKCDPAITYMWRSTYRAVVPAYHMNKTHWNSIILDGTVPTMDIQNMIADSFTLTKPKQNTK
ncbi:MAG: MmcQ/YjbR family DNA-binding protein [Clostridia bacterium]|nr:MmcQ/YjbR family DNA-binding protein [Clostridia bacterium]